MRYVIYLFFLFSLLSCNSKRTTYQGYIVNSTKQVIKGISVCQITRDSLFCTPVDSTGFFSFQRQCDSSIVLLIKYKGQSIDSIRTSFLLHGEREVNPFTAKRRDTLFIKQSALKAYLSTEI